MSNQNKLILGVGILLVCYSLSSKQEVIVLPYQPNIVVPNIEPQPAPPQPNTPDLVDNIIYDDHDKAVELSLQYNRPLVLIFGSSWCQFCQDLKNDLPDLEQFKRCVVAIINTDQSKDLVSKYHIKGLPTSIIIKGEKEVRKSGYKRNDYEKWLNGNL